MTFECNSALPKRFVTSTLPWLIGLGAALIYFATLSRWATINSVGVVARASGWLWQPDLHQPLAFLFYFPFRFLPEQWVAPALNGFNALMAALVVTLLARSVALLPHDRTADQRDLVENEHSLFTSGVSWIPPVLAAVVLGLQISFWEDATAVSAEMIDALVFAYVVRCLLEFQIDRRQTWMFRAVFVYAAGITNNWALIALAPCFLAAIIWIKGVAFFNGDFLIRVLLCGLCGLSLYLLLPALQSFSNSAPVDFWAGLKANLGVQKRTLANVYFFFKANKDNFVVMGATSVLPLFFIGLKWRSSFGDSSPVGVVITKGVFHIAHAVFFAVCLLVVLSPPYSPRQIIPELAFLNHTFLGALVVGYCAGYFLLICSPAARSRHTPVLLKAAGRAGWGAVLLALIVMPLALLGRNLEPIRLTNGALLDKFMTLALGGLPPAPGTIVGDDPGRLALVRSFLVHRGDATNYLFYDTQSARWTDYHAAQRRTQGGRWPALFAELNQSADIRPIGMISFLAQLAEAGPVYYLEPSFGYYFERFELLPQGLAYVMTNVSTNSLLPAALTAEMIASNQRVWSEFDEGFLPDLKRHLRSDTPPSRPRWQALLYDRLHLSDENVPTASVIGNYCSRSATYWAVQLQKQGLWSEAAQAFQRALVLNPDNVVADINLKFNEARQQGKPAPAGVAAKVEDEFGRYQDWNQVMAACGPFDEPRFTFEQGRTFFGSRLYRQALQHIARVVELEPTNYVANVWLADLYNILGKPEEALRRVAQIRGEPDTFGLNPTKGLNLDRLEATALLRQGEKNRAGDVLRRALETPELGVQFRSTAALLFLQAGMHAEALPLLELVVKDNPADVRSLANLGYACLQLAKYDQAREVLTRALELDPKNNVVRLNRAITLLRAKEYAAAKEDYLILQEEFPKAYQVQYGLGEIAAAKNDPAAAVAHFEKSMELTPVGTPDYVQVSNRLASARAELK